MWQISKIVQLRDIPTVIFERRDTIKITKKMDFGFIIGWMGKNIVESLISREKELKRSFQLGH
jgi:hypothetical protein